MWTVTYVKKIHPLIIWYSVISHSESELDGGRLKKTLSHHHGSNVLRTLQSNYQLGKYGQTLNCPMNTSIQQVLPVKVNDVMRE